MTEKFIRDAALKKMKDKYDAGVAERGGKGMEEAGDVLNIEWLKMLQEEHMDSVYYCERMIQNLEKKFDWADVEAGMCFQDKEDDALYWYLAAHPYDKENFGGHGFIIVFNKRPPIEEPAPYIVLIARSVLVRKPELDGELRC